MKANNAALAERLVRLAQSPKMVRAMGMAASRDAVQRFSLERMGSNYVKLYREVVKQRTRHY